MNICNSYVIVYSTKGIDLIFNWQITFVLICNLRKNLGSTNIILVQNPFPHKFFFEDMHLFLKIKYPNNLYSALINQRHKC